MFWLSRPTGVRVESPHRPYLVPTRLGHIHHKLQPWDAPPSPPWLLPRLDHPRFEESNRIRQIIDRECRERVGNIQRNIVPFLDGGKNIHAVYLQPLKKTISV